MDSKEANEGDPQVQQIEDGDLGFSPDNEGQDEYETAQNQ